MNMEKDQNGSNVTNGEEDMEDEDTTPFHCDVCEATVEGGPNKHEQSKLHKDVVSYKEQAARKEELEATFETKGFYALTQVETREFVPRGANTGCHVGRWLKVVHHPLLGVEYVYEIIPKNENTHRYYVCRLCGVVDVPIMKHMISIIHRAKYLTKHSEDIKPYIARIRNEEERALVDELIETNGFPKYRKDWSDFAINRALVYLTIRMKGDLPRVQFKMHKETQECHIKRMRQPCVKLQLDGIPNVPHYTDYPSDLMPGLWDHGNNFALHETAPETPSDEDQFIMSLLGLVPRPGLLPDPAQSLLGPAPYTNPMLMPGMLGPIPNDEVSKKITLLAWMHKTAQKLDMEAVGPQEYELCLRVIELLRCGVSMFMANPNPKEICFYPNQDLKPEGIYLKQWLELSIKYFESAWLCSEREVNMANVLIEQIDQARNKYLDTQQPMLASRGGAAVEHHHDPYDDIMGPSEDSWGDFGGGYGSYGNNGGGYGGGGYDDYSGGYNDYGGGYDDYGGGYDDYGGGYGGRGQRYPQQQQDFGMKHGHGRRQNPYNKSPKRGNRQGRY